MNNVNFRIGVAALSTVFLFAVVMGSWPAPPMLGRALDQPGTPPPAPEMRPRGFFPYAARGVELNEPFTRSTLPPLGVCTRELITTPSGYLTFYDVAVDGRGTTWFATDRGAIGDLADGSRVRLGVAEGLARDQARAVAIDANGFPWFGTATRYVYPSGETFEDGGLTGYFYPGTDTRRNTDSAGHGAFGPVEDLAIDGQNDKWVVMGNWRLGPMIERGGVYRLSGDDRWEYYPTAAGIDLDDVNHVAADAFGNLWFDGWGDFVLRRADGTWTRDLGAGGPKADEVSSFTTDPTRRQVWLAVDRGDDVALYMRDADGIWRSFEVPRDGERGGLGAHALGVDGRGNVWFASEAQTGVRWADGRWEWFPRTDALGGYISWITVDARGVVWLATGSESLVRVDCR